MTPMVAGAAPRHDPPPARTSAAAVGVVYGGITADGFGLMVETNKSRTEIVRMAAGLGLRCTSGITIGQPDSWLKLPVKKGKFSATFKDTHQNDDGTTMDVEDVMAGKFNASKTTVSGTWSLKVTDLDTTGSATDTCDSGTMHWKAKQ